MLFKFLSFIRWIRNNYLIPISFTFLKKSSKKLNGEKLEIYNYFPVNSVLAASFSWIFFKALYKLRENLLFEVWKRQHLCQLLSNQVSF